MIHATSLILCINLALLVLLMPEEGNCQLTFTPGWRSRILGKERNTRGGIPLHKRQSTEEMIENTANEMWGASEEEQLAFDLDTACRSIRDHSPRNALLPVSVIHYLIS